MIILRYVIHHPATTETYTLSLHDALPISRGCRSVEARRRFAFGKNPTCHCMHLPIRLAAPHTRHPEKRSEEHTSELQSRENLVCRLLLEKKTNENKRRQSMKTLTKETR